jgi:diguanylate cyclase (GGDEF)-like protein
MILIFFTSFKLFASPQITLEDNISSYSDFNVEYLKEPFGQSLGIEEISKIPFKQMINNKFAFGYKNDHFWFRFSVYNNSIKPKDMILEISEQFHRITDMYIITDPIIYKKNGLAVPLKEREIKTSNPAFALHFSAHEHKEIYIHMQTIYSLFGAIELKTSEQFYIDNQNKINKYLFYFGAMLGIALYNLFIFFYLRSRVYLYYVGYVFVFILWTALYKGFLLPYISMRIYDLLQITIPIFFVFLILFTQSILKTKQAFPIIHKILNSFIVISGISLVWMLISMHSGFLFMNLISTVIIPLLLILSFLAAYKDKTIAKVYLIALSIFIFGMSIISLLALGVLPYSVFLSNAPIIASFFEIILFSFLLAYRINLLSQKSFAAKRALVKQQKSESARLFHEVAEKTIALNKANRRLKQELEKKKILEEQLKYQATTDSLTGIMNRRAFMNVFEQEMKKSILDLSELSCMIIDIDNFKKVNDSYGHHIGDKVIGIIADKMTQHTRTMDKIGRIGGEEFAIIMPHTDRGSAFQIADRLREYIAKDELAFDDKTIQVTVSIGLTHRKKGETDTQTVLQRTDAALYEAKRNGRNRVCYL